jgi:ferrochelatase
VLLVNLGSPDQPTAEALKPYLTEFLMDPDVIDIPSWARWMLVHWIIVPRRAGESAALYRKIWTEDGSPLIVNSLRFRAAVAERLGSTMGVAVGVALGMRYGTPSIEDAVEELSLSELERLIVFPLYPQFAQSSTLTVTKKVREVLAAHRHAPEPEWIEPFYGDHRYIDAMRAVAADRLAAFRPDLCLFSFHGVPERHVKRQHDVCLTSDTCCDAITEVNRNCYRAQCFQTARAVANALGIPAGNYTVSFQSRLGPTPWIRPFTDHVIADLPLHGVDRLAVLCPSFVADCLETLDEIENREKERFIGAGGKDLLLVPSLNDHPAWVAAAADLVGDRIGAGVRREP